MNVGERIKQKRIELNMSQDELAKKVGYRSRSSIQKIEASRDLPLRKVSKMARALGCTESYLMGWTSDFYPTTVSGHDPGEILIVGDNVKNLPVFSEGDDIEKALELYKKYINAPSDVREAVNLMLKSAQPKP